MIDKDILFSVVATTLLVLLLTGGLVMLFFLHGRQRLKQAVELSESRLAFEQELRKVEAEVVESVRNEFARELHDNIGQLLTAMNIQIENQKLDHPETAKAFSGTQIYLEEVTSQLRMLSKTMNNDHLGSVGLFAAMNMELDRLSRLNRFAIHRAISEQLRRFDSRRELMIFRIFQEIAQNVLKHAAAKNLYVSAEVENEMMAITIRDDGRGFDRDKILALPQGLGLRNIFKRAALADVRCELVTSPDSGCTWRLSADPNEHGK